MYNNYHDTTKKPTNPSNQNKNYYSQVQNKQSQYAFHQHGYDLSAYTQMVSAGIEPEKAIENIEYFYKNMFRIEKAELV